MEKILLLNAANFREDYPTIEGMQHRMRGFPSIGLISDEGATILNGRATASLAVLNDVWGGANISVERKSSPAFTIYKPRMTCSLMVQPEVFQKFLNDKDTARGVGFLARFLVAYPASTKGQRVISGQDMQWHRLEKFQERMMQLMRKSMVATDKKTLGFSPEAQEYWKQCANYFEESQRPSGISAGISDFASKFAENLARLAALFHVVNECQSDEICLLCVQSAYQVTLFYADEALRLFSPPAQIPQHVSDAFELERWLNVQILNSREACIILSSISQFCPNHLRHDNKRLKKAIATIVATGRYYVDTALGRKTKIICKSLSMPYLYQLAPAYYNYPYSI